MRTPDQQEISLADQEDGLLTRWQKRKARVLEEARLETEKSAENDHTAETARPTDADLPDIESLNAESDFKAFMSPNVSDALRKLALRKLFHGASFNISDGLDVYDGDYTKFAKLGNVMTADIANQLERKAKASLENTVADKKNTHIKNENNEIPLQEQTVEAAAHEEKGMAEAIDQSCPDHTCESQRDQNHAV